MLNLLLKILTGGLKKVPTEAIYICLDGLSFYERYLVDKKNQEALSQFQFELFTYLHVQYVLQQRSLYRELARTQLLLKLQIAIVFYYKKIAERKANKLFAVTENDSISPQTLFKHYQQILIDELNRRREKQKTPADFVIPGLNM